MKTASAIIVFLIVTSLSASGQWTTNGNDIYNTNTGNIGINTTSPQSKLHLNGNGTTGGAPITIMQNYIFSGLVGSLRFASGYNNFDSWSGIEAYTPGGVDIQDLRFYTTYGTRNERMRIDQYGNVGIGTNAPSNKFHVAGGGITCSSGTGILQFSPQTGSILMANGTNPWTYIDFKGSGNLASDFRGRIIHDDNTGFSFITGGSVTGLNISNNGFIGMGTTSPLAKLDVRGNIYCGNTLYVGTADGATSSQISGYALAVNGIAIFNKAKVKLYGNWPDYVFDEKYNLLSLVELEKFLKENKHLPEVPSAIDVAKDGIDLGDNQSILLKKIEELTLYVIEQNKKMEVQNDEIRNLQKQVISLQQK